MTQGVGSGGEQSVLLHLPLFATAASMYDLVPGAPRIIALDEARTRTAADCAG